MNNNNWINHEFNNKNWIKNDFNNNNNFINNEWDNKNVNPEIHWRTKASKQQQQIESNQCMSRQQQQRQSQRQLLFLVSHSTVDWRLRARSFTSMRCALQRARGIRPSPSKVEQHIPWLMAANPSVNNKRAAPHNNANDTTKQNEQTQTETHLTYDRNTLKRTNPAGCQRYPPQLVHF